jgi:DNA-binding GntR family transcriptional regulator
VSATKAPIGQVVTEASLNRVSTVDALADALRARVLGGELAPGTPVREAELAAMFGVGRHSVRAALQALVFEGVLRHQPNRGAFVPEFSAADIEDLFMLRLAIEEQAAKVLAVRRTPIPEAVAAVEMMEGLSGEEPWHEVMALDLEFHRSLVREVRSERMAKAFGAIQAELALLLAQLRPQYVRRERIGNEHRLLLKGILSHREAVAGRAAREHLNNTLEDLIVALEASHQISPGPGR